MENKKENLNEIIKKVTNKHTYKTTKQKENEIL